MKKEIISRQYKSNFLTNVVCRFDFPKILSFNEEKVSKFQEKIIDLFPILEINFEEDDENFIGWQFSDRTRKKHIYVYSEFLCIEYNKYKGFGEFFDEIKNILKIFIDLYSINIFTNLNLRYLNQIEINEGNPLDWNNLINDKLYVLSNNIINENDKVIRYVHKIVIKENDYLLEFQFGFFNSEYPAILSRKEFLLDYECSITDDIIYSDIYNKINDLHKIINKWFEKSIADGLREKMDKNEK